MHPEPAELSFQFPWRTPSNDFCFSLETVQDIPSFPWNRPMKVKSYQSHNPAYDSVAVVTSDPQGDITAPDRFGSLCSTLIQITSFATSLVTVGCAEVHSVCPGGPQRQLPI